MKTTEKISLGGFAFVVESANAVLCFVSYYVAIGHCHLSFVVNSSTVGSVIHGEDAVYYFWFFVGEDIVSASFCSCSVVDESAS